MKTIPSRIFTVLLVILLSFSTLGILKVKAQEDTITVPGNWSEVVRFAGESSVNTDSFTCNHSEWRIRWEANIMDLHFYFTNYFLQITTFPEGTMNDYIDFINGSFSSISESSNLVSGTRYIHNNTGSFYLRIIPSTHTENYRIVVEQNLDSPTPLPSPTPRTSPIPTTSPTPSPDLTPAPSPESESEFPTIQLLSLALTVIIGLGILAYSMRRRP